MSHLERSSLNSCKNMHLPSTGGVGVVIRLAGWLKHCNLSLSFKSLSLVAYAWFSSAQIRVPVARIAVNIMEICCASEAQCGADHDNDKYSTAINSENCHTTPPCAPTPLCSAPMRSSQGEVRHASMAPCHRP